MWEEAVDQVCQDKELTEQYKLALKTNGTLKYKWNKECKKKQVYIFLQTMISLIVNNRKQNTLPHDVPL